MDFMGYVKKGVEIVKLDRDAISGVASDPGSFGPAVLFFGISGLAAGVSGAVVTGGAGSFMLLSGPVFAVIGSFAGVGILHLLSRLMGGTARYRGYYSALGIGNIIRWALVVPFLGFIAALWYLPVMVVVTERVHGISTARAVFVVLLPAIVLFLIILSVIMIAGMAVFMSIMDSGTLQGL